jgi:large subunit ribosomal protein L32
MAVPKRKHSKSRRDKRRTHQGLKPNPAIAYCDHCQAPVLPHNACSDCGYYKGRKVDHTVQEQETG